MTPASTVFAGAFGPTGARSEITPALAVGADGVVNLFVTGPDQGWFAAVWRMGSGRHRRRLASGACYSPRLVFSLGGGSLELLARGPDRRVQYGRFIGGAWTAPVSLGIATDARPALVAAAGPALAAALMATDGTVHVSEFAGQAAPAQTTARVSVPKYVGLCGRWIGDTPRWRRNDGERTRS